MWGIGFLNRGSLCILFSIFFFFNFNVFAQRAFVFDYDGTIVEDRTLYEGIHTTTYRLFRVNYKDVSIQPNISGPEYIDISHEDWEKLTRPKYDPITKYPQPQLLLARAEGKLGSLIPFKLSDGSSFIPGYYMVDPNKTFLKYNESLEGVNYFEQSFALGFEKSLRGEGRVQGPYFELFYYLINNPATRHSVWVVSSRGHSEEEVFEKLKLDRDVRKLIQSDVSDEDLQKITKRHKMLMREEYHLYDNKGGIPRVSVLKARIVTEIAKALIQTNPSKYIEHLDSSGEKLVKGVELHFFEDRYEYLEETVSLLQDLVNRRLNLKVLIHNAGTVQDIELSEKPQVYALTPYSYVREISNYEWSMDFVFSKINKLSSRNTVYLCSYFFGGAK